MSEFKVINEYIKQAWTDDSVALGIGDDAAVMQVPKGQQIVQTMDTMVMDVHFDERFSADALAHKLLHVNLSDIAAMGATAKWATVSLTVPSIDEHWIDEFSSGLKKRCQALGISLVGGDTTSGPLSVTMNLTGLVKEGEFITRSGANEGDEVYVSGFLGDAALALTKPCLNDHSDNNQELVERLLFPQARYQLGKHLGGIASACIDISDGLLSDLQHICDASNVSAHIDVNKLLYSEAYKRYFTEQKLVLNPDYALNGGDDYELCFTVPKDKIESIEAIFKSIDYPVTKIGKMVNLEQQLSINCYLSGIKYQSERFGWEHFSE